ncbi:MAG: 5'/3'-nucleotidase SurE [Candidatus Hodarchaeales archaeon]
MRKYKILLSNDDGIDSPGLIALAGAINNISDYDIDLKIAAPSTQQTAVSKAVSFNKPLRIFKREVIEGVESIAVNGTPADAFYLGMEYFKGNFDFVVSGINAGENTSIHSVLTSGTLAVCLEAAIMGMQGWGFSLDVDSKYFFGTAEDQDLGDYEIAAKTAVKLMEKVLTAGGMPAKISFLNVNFPKELMETSPVKIGRSSLKKYNNYPIERKDPRGIKYYWIWGDMIDTDPDTDTYYLKKEQAISVTPFCLQKLQEIDNDLVQEIDGIFN